MAFPVLLQKLFGNSGAGPKLRPDILPLTVDGSAPSGTNSVAVGSVTAAQLKALDDRLKAVEQNYVSKTNPTVTGTLTIEG